MVYTPGCRKYTRLSGRDDLKEKTEAPRRFRFRAGNITVSIGVVKFGVCVERYSGCVSPSLALEHCQRHGAQPLGG